MRRNMAPRAPKPRTPAPNARLGAPPSPPATPPEDLVLTCTDLPGVYRNRRGEFTDREGSVLPFEELKRIDDQRFTDVLGYVPKTPGEVLKAVSLDPRCSFDVRLSAARAGAPYFDMRMPLRVEGQVDHSGVMFDPSKLAGMKKADRELLLKMLGQLGVKL